MAVERAGGICRVWPVTCSRIGGGSDVAATAIAGNCVRDGRYRANCRQFQNKDALELLIVLVGWLVPGGGEYF